VTNDSLMDQIGEQIVFQQKWKRIMSGAYFSVAAFAILLGSGATIVAAWGYSTEASLLAGGATSIYGIEKALLLREKWAHHLASEMDLRALKSELATGVVNDREAAKAFGGILKGYAAKLPTAPVRDNAV
jgi:hypothetical protein